MDKLSLHQVRNDLQNIIDDLLLQNQKNFWSRTYVLQTTMKMQRLLFQKTVPFRLPESTLLLYTCQPEIW